MILYGSVLLKPWSSHVSTHVATPSSANSSRLTTALAREGFVSVCACTEPAGTGIGAVCVERGGQTWPNKMMDHTYDDTVTHTLTEKLLIARHPTLVRFVMKKLFFSEKSKKKRLARLIMIVISSLISRLASARMHACNVTCMQMTG